MVTPPGEVGPQMQWTVSMRISARTAEKAIRKSASVHIWVLKWFISWFLVIDNSIIAKINSWVIG
jgi:hypothetical protein